MQASVERVLLEERKVEVTHVDTPWLHGTVSDNSKSPAHLRPTTPRLAIFASHFFVGRPLSYAFLAFSGRCDDLGAGNDTTSVVNLHCYYRYLNLCRVPTATHLEPPPIHTLV